jgi:N-hydroxyarylamine O-acetyltransferase
MHTVSDYLTRIHYHGPTEPTLKTLRALHLAHLYTVPFENLDIHLGRKIVLEEDRLLDKVITQHRGGFCYELNGAFAWLLRELGFNVMLLSAGVWSNKQQRFGPEADHLCLMVQLEHRWLADVGFGDSFRTPLSFETAGDQVQDGTTFRLILQDTDWVMQELDGEGQVAGGYRFALRPRTLQDFTYGCHYHQTSPDTGFTRNIVCSKAIPNGTLTISDMKQITTLNGQRDERTLESQAERLILLREQFDIALPDGAEFKSPTAV